MSQGHVRWFDKKKGYGFVKQDDQDVFIHWSEMKEKFIPEKDDLISFDIIKGEKGPKAQNITKVG